jgi:spermidine/putrescine ABC transporter ATP-binding subunit
MIKPLRGAEVRLEKILKTYGSVRAADDISLTVNNGEFVTLLGPSGSGKTTILMIIAGFVEPDKGDVYIGGSKVTNVPAHRRGLGVVFQHYALFPHMTIFDNIAYPLRMRKILRDQIRKRVQASLDLVQLPDIGWRHISQLSGGQQQRVAVARALISEPQVLLMDEPLGALDKKLREQMQIELRSLQQSLGITTIYVTHDQEEAMALSDRVVVLREGRIEQIGATDELYEHPKTQFVADFIGTSNFLKGEIKIDNEKLVFMTKEGLRLPVSNSQKEKTNRPIGLILRPERIRWSKDEKTDVSISGVIDAVTYLGERIRYLIHLDQGPTLVVTHTNLQSERRFNIGDAVKLGWNHTDVTIL